MRSAVLLALGLVTTPLSAQDAAAPDAPSAATNGVVGPRELQDFSLPGTTVRSSDPAPAIPSAPRPAPSDPIASPKPSPAIVSARTKPSAAATPTVKTAAPGAASTTTTRGLPAPPPRIEAPPATPLPAPTAILPRSTPAAPWWPWLLAGLAAAGAAAFVFVRRQRSQATLAFARTGRSETLPVAPRAPVPASAAAPRAVAEPVAPPPAPPLAGGIVSTAFQPDLYFAFTPLSVAIDEEGTAVVVFDLVVHNQGSAPARDVLVEAGMFNASPDQDTKIGTFFANPRVEGDRIPVIAPQGRVGVRSRVSIPGEMFSPVEMEGRKLLVPLVAFNALYRWSGGEKQRSASFLVGRGNNDEPKLAPFALDRGSRAWGDVAARTHSTGLAA